jgi:putative sterol carrier protein
MARNQNAPSEEHDTEPTKSATEEFLESLPTRGPNPLLAKVSGTLRFDAVDGDRVEHWHVTFDKGSVRVSRRNAKADAVIRADRQMLDEIFSGRENAMAALLRGALIPEGDPALMLRFQRILSAFPRRETIPAAGNA